MCNYVDAVVLFLEMRLQALFLRGQLTGGWKDPHGDFPISVVEGHGSMIGQDFCLVSGFVNGADGTTPDIYCIDTQNTSANWRKRVSLKDSDSMEGTKLGIGLSHGAEAVVGSKFYMCGGVSRDCVSFRVRL